MAADGDNERQLTRTHLKKRGKKRGEIDPLTGGSVVINNGCVGCDVDHRLSATLFCAMKV